MPALVRRPLWGLLPLVALACRQSSLVGPDYGPTAEIARETPRLGVLTQNFYVGADVDAVILALATPDPSDDLPALQAAIQTLIATDVEARAAAIADQIARTRPHVVGLQEMSVIDLNLVPLGLPVVMHVDFFGALERALRARGLPYRFAVRNHNFTVSPITGVSLSDDDLLLVDRSRVTVLETMHGTFEANLGPVAPGVDLRRGWVAARLTLGGVPYVVASTHPESDLGPGHFDQLRAAQVGELVARLARYDRVVIMGDLNDEPGSLMYRLLFERGFRDVWAALKRGEGYTCCHLADLSNERAQMTKRIDFVFARGFAAPGADPRGSIELLGIKPSERIPGPFYPIWPSDHAGIYAALVRPSDQVAVR